MSNLNMICENHLEMVELSDEAMEAVAGGAEVEIKLGSFSPVQGLDFTLLIGIDTEELLDRGNEDE